MLQIFQLIVTGTVICPNGDHTSASMCFDVTTSGEDGLFEAGVSLTRTFLTKVPNVRRGSVQVDVISEEYMH